MILGHPWACRWCTVMLVGCGMDPLCVCCAFIRRVSCCFLSGFPRAWHTQREASSCLLSPERNRAAPSQSPAWQMCLEIDLRAPDSSSFSGLTCNPGREKRKKAQAQRAAGMASEWGDILIRDAASLPQAFLGGRRGISWMREYFKGFL